MSTQSFNCGDLDCPECNPPLSVYVAGGSAERLTVVRPLLNALRAAGLTITHDWTACEGYERPSSDLERAAWARADLDGVKRANVVWYVAPQNPSEGSHAELGAAIVLRKRLIVSGPHASRESRLFALLGERYDTHEEALAELVRAAGRSAS